MSHLPLTRQGLFVTVYRGLRETLHPRLNASVRYAAASDNRRQLTTILSAATALEIFPCETSRCVTIRTCISEIPIASTPAYFNRAQISPDFRPVRETSKMTMFVATFDGSIEMPGISATPLANARAFS